MEHKSDMFHEVNDMRKSRLFVIFSFVFVFSLSLLDISWAGLKLTPSIGIREEYNDNIFLTPSHEEEDFITSINPAVYTTFDTKWLTLSLDYGLNFRFYAHHSELNETSLDKAQRAKLETTFSLFKNIFFVKVSDEYQRVGIDERRQVALDNLVANMTDSNRFSLNPYIGYPLTATLNAKVGYIYENIWYKAKEGDDAENHSYNVNLLKQLSPEISLSLSYNYLLHRPKKTDQYDEQNAVLGMGYQVGPRLSLNGQIGQTWFDYENREDSNYTIWTVGGRYLLTTVLSLSADYSQSFSESVNVGTYKSRTVSGTMSYAGKIPSRLSAYRTMNTFTAIQREDRSNGVIIDFGLPISPRITGRLTGNYNDYEFLPGGEEATRYGVRLGFDYALRITTVSLGYTYNLNNSTVNSNDYRNNIVWLQARFSMEPALPF
jgi:hypothetical protein